MPVLAYFRNLPPSRAILWGYLVWYAVTLVHHFDPSPRLWLNSLGISLVIGTALLLSLAARSRDPWQTFRMFLMPFCVSSFSSLIKGRNFIVIFSTDKREFLIATASCLTFAAFLLLLKKSTLPPI